MAIDQVAPPFGITVCGVAELEGHCNTRASHVLSILDPGHPVPEAFGAFGEHEKLELRFHDIIEPRPGRLAPEPKDIEAVLAFGRDMDRATHLLVHCFAGVSRSTASMALILAQAMPDMAEDAVLELVHGIREKAWPNLLMMEFGDAILGRKGRLVDATHALHRLQLDVRPHIAEFMIGEGRQREVDGARHHRMLGRAASLTTARATIP